MIRARAAMLLLAALFAAGQARATEAIVTGLSQNRVQITANFDGSEILIYGAVKRDAPAPTDAPLEVIVTVEGPSTPLVIRRKEKAAGIWLNRSSVTIDAAPSFYAVATTDKLPAPSVKLASSSVLACTVAPSLASASMSIRRSRSPMASSCALAKAAFRLKRTKPVAA